MRQTRKWVHLIHELRQLRGSEELLYCGNNWTNVDERLWRDGLDVLGGHALTHNTFHATKTDANLVLNQFPHGTDTTVGEVVLVVEAVARFCPHEVQQVGTAGENLGRRKYGMILIWTFEVDTEGFFDALDFWTKLAVQLVTTNPAQVITTALEERAAEVVTSRFD